MKTRVLTAVVALLVVLPPIIWGGYWGVALLVALVALLGIEEFSRLVRPVRRLDFLVGELVAGMTVFWAIQLAAHKAMIVTGLAVLGLFVLHLLRFEDIQKAGPMLVGSIASVLYVPLLMAFLPLIRGTEPDGLRWLFFLMLITWAGDSGAYLAGRTFGRHKLYPQVSPGKTVEGFFGGIAFAVMGAFLARATFFPTLTVLDCVFLAPMADIAGVLGDLAESLLKRSAGVKDSGRIFPGHGGILDRVDSLLFSAPVLYAYLLWR